MRLLSSSVVAEVDSQLPACPVGTVHELLLDLAGALELLALQPAPVAYPRTTMAADARREQRSAEACGAKQQRAFTQEAEAVTARHVVMGDAATRRTQTKLLAVGTFGCMTQAKKL